MTSSLDFSNSTRLSFHSPPVDEKAQMLTLNGPSYYYQEVTSLSSQFCLCHLNEVGVSSQHLACLGSTVF